jgi:hypothetical protein
VAFAPRYNPTLVWAAAPEPHGAKRFLQRMHPRSWRFAHHLSADLVRQIEYLPWSGRVEIFDTYFLRQAEAILRPKGLTELVGGQLPAGEPLEQRQLETRRARFAEWSRMMMTAALLDLDERAEVMSAQQGLTYLLTLDMAYSKAAAVWTTFHGMSTIVEALHRLPGYALVLLAASPNDTAERFMARDAFWAGVMARS